MLSLYLMHAGVHYAQEQCDVGHWRLAAGTDPEGGDRRLRI